MARNTFSMNQTSKDRPEYFICPKCGKKLDISNFYTHSRKPMGILPICKTCMYDMVLDETGVNRQGMIALMKYLDMPFIQKEYEECVNKNTNSPKRAVSVYMNLKMTKNEYADLRFKDSMYDVIVDLDLKEETVISLDNDRVDLLEEEISPQQAKIQRAKELKAKWGNFDSLDYLERCERLYIEIVQGGYVIA